MTAMVPLAAALATGAYVASGFMGTKSKFRSMSNLGLFQPLKEFKSFKILEYNNTEWAVLKQLNPVKADPQFSEVASQLKSVQPEIFCMCGNIDLRFNQLLESEGYTVIRAECGEAN